MMRFRVWGLWSRYIYIYMNVERREERKRDRKRCIYRVCRAVTLGLILVYIAMSWELRIQGLGGFTVQGLV